ncbi:hypothetical protein HF1_01770 [Mycoplasma haemofelis str. Langford 1]|uniref:Uncharacterized protein n=2 Tax=Mycoplasma haemofelis TaxID=29501 RepID=F6FGB4_MYCHI|nr:hypothetical protein [Mycoplasma haemofelis]AEG72504.1 hypothetical protein MHF_0205 [Mycoplasma haemofelis Ohio2]CBY92185.1 hypothetical protein HF1_01770 [Mycoplasma haemofelis str. Langford 1]
MSKVRMGFAGGLASLTAGSVGAYLGLERDDDSINKVLNLHFTKTTRRGGCKVLIEGEGTHSNQKYEDFYKSYGDKNGEFARICLNKIPSLNKELENVLVRVKKGSDGSYVFDSVGIEWNS